MYTTATTRGRCSVKTKMLRGSLALFEAWNVQRQRHCFTCGDEQRVYKARNFDHTGRDSLHGPQKLLEMRISPTLQQSYVSCWE